MSEIYIYLFLLFMSVFVLNSGRLYGVTAPVAGDHVALIEHLSKYSEKTKNYRSHPKNYTTYGYFIAGVRSGEEVTYEYHFPLIEKAEAKISINFHPRNFSAAISSYGVHSSCFARADDSSYGFRTVDERYLKANMNKDGFYFHAFEEGGFGVDYSHVVHISSDLGKEIACFLVQELQRIGRDDYKNRVTAALNFVQYIPYGIPDFDAGEYGYFQLGLPHESVAIAYADCDSKSVMFAGILKWLIKNENIVLVSCTADGTGHMITGVSHLPFAGQRVEYNGRDYLLLETTSPIPIDRHHLVEKFMNAVVIPIRSHG